MGFFKGDGRRGGDTKSSVPITQTAHGFAVPQAVYLDDGDGLYKLAKADVLATANAIGIVSAVQDVNSFTLTTAGAQNIFTGLTEGKTYYVSESTAGALTDTAPTIRRPILNAISATRGIIFIDAISQDLAGNGLPYVVGLAGGAIEYQFNTIQSAIDAVEAAGANDTAIVVTPGTYTEDLTIASTTLSISSLGSEPDIILVVGDVTITSAAPISNSTVSISE